MSKAQLRLYEDSSKNKEIVYNNGFNIHVDDTNKNVSIIKKIYVYNDSSRIIYNVKIQDINGKIYNGGITINPQEIKEMEIVIPITVTQGIQQSPKLKITYDNIPNL